MKKLQDYIKEYYDLMVKYNWSYLETASKFKSDYPDIEISIRSLRRKLSQIKKDENQDTLDKTTIVENESSRELTYIGERSLKSKEDAVKFFKIDLDKEEIYKSVFNSWDVVMKDKSGKPTKRTNYQVKLFVRPKEKQKINFEIIKEEILKSICDLQNKPQTITRGFKKDGHLLVIDPADIHIGKLSDSFETGNDFNNQIAIQRVLEGVYGILDKAQGFNIDKILFVAGNDVLHVDNKSKSTTNGTLQDMDGMWHSNFLLAKKLYIDILNILVQKANVSVVFNPSNHDYITGFFLMDVIKTYFKDMSNMNFDVSPAHRKYFKYFNNLIGTTHGDGAKQADLPLLMANECEYWSECTHRYIYTHHLHHKFSKDYVGVTVESLRSPSGTDSWHHVKGYTGVPKAVEGFIHHPKFGQVSRLTHIFK